MHRAPLDGLFGGCSASMLEVTGSWSVERDPQRMLLLEQIQSDVKQLEEMILTQLGEAEELLVVLQNASADVRGVEVLVPLMSSSPATDICSACARAPTFLQRECGKRIENAWRHASSLRVLSNAGGGHIPTRSQEIGLKIGVTASRLEALIVAKGGRGGVPKPHTSNMCTHAPSTPPHRNRETGAEGDSRGEKERDGEWDARSLSSISTLHSVSPGKKVRAHTIPSGHSSTPDSPYSNVSLASRQASQHSPHAPAYSQHPRLARQFQLPPSRLSAGPSHTGSPQSSSFSQSGAQALLSAHEHLQFLEQVGGAPERRSSAGHAGASLHSVSSRDQAHAYAQTLSLASAHALRRDVADPRSAATTTSPSVSTVPAHVPVSPSIKRGNGKRAGEGHSSDRKGGAGRVRESAYDRLDEEQEAKSVGDTCDGEPDPVRKAASQRCEGGVEMNAEGRAGSERGRGSRRCLSYLPDTQESSRSSRLSGRDTREASAREPTQPSLEGMHEENSSYHLKTQGNISKRPGRMVASSESTFSGSGAATSTGSSGSVKGVEVTNLSQQTSGSVDGLGRLRVSNGPATPLIKMFPGEGHAGRRQAETPEATSRVYQLLPSDKKLSILEEKLALLEALEAEEPGAPEAKVEAQPAHHADVAETSVNREVKTGPPAADDVDAERAKVERAEEVIPLIKLPTDDDIARYCQRCHKGTARSRWVAWSCSACGCTKWLVRDKRGQEVGLGDGRGENPGGDGRLGGMIEGNHIGAVNVIEGKETRAKLSADTKTVENKKAAQVSAVPEITKSKVPSEPKAVALDSRLDATASSKTVQPQDAPATTSLPVGAGNKCGDDGVGRSDKAAKGGTGTGDGGSQSVGANGCAPRVIQGAIELVGARGRKKDNQAVPSGSIKDAKSQSYGTNSSNVVGSADASPSCVESSANSALGSVRQTLHSSVPPALPPLNWTALSQSEKKGDLATLQVQGEARRTATVNGAEDRIRRGNTRDSYRSESSEEMTTAPTSPTVSDRETDTQRELDQDTMLHHLQMQVQQAHDLQLQEKHAAQLMADERATLEELILNLGDALQSERQRRHAVEVKCTLLESSMRSLGSEPAADECSTPTAHTAHALDPLVTKWLWQINLQHLAGDFARERIDSTSLALLSHGQLQELGVHRMGDRTKLLRRAIQSLEDRGVDGQSAVAAHANRNLLDSSASPPWLRSLWFGKPPQSGDDPQDSVEPEPADALQRWRHLSARLIRSHLPFLAILRLRATQLIKKAKRMGQSTGGLAKANTSFTPDRCGPTLHDCVIEVLSVKDDLSGVLAHVGAELENAKLEAEHQEEQAVAAEEEEEESWDLEAMRNRFNLCRATMEELGLQRRGESYAAFQKTFHDVVSELLQRATMQTETLKTLRQAQVHHGEVREGRGTHAKEEGAEGTRGGHRIEEVASVYRA